MASNESLLVCISGHRVPLKLLGVTSTEGGRRRCHREGLHVSKTATKGTVARGRCKAGKGLEGPPEPPSDSDSGWAHGWRIIGICSALRCDGARRPLLSRA